MKLSNKILIGFFGFIFLYLTAVFAELRLTGTSNILDDQNSIAETVALSGITHIVLNDLGKNIYVTGADRPRLEVRSASGDGLKKLQYAISGDTLTLLSLPKDTKTMKVSIFVPQAS